MPSTPCFLAPLLHGSFLRSTIGPRCCGHLLHPLLWSSIVPPLLWSLVVSPCLGHLLRPSCFRHLLPCAALVTCCTLLLWSPVAPIALVTCCRLLLWSLVEPPLLESLVASHCCGHLLPLPCGGHLLPHVASVTYCPPCFGHLLSPSRLPPLPHCGFNKLWPPSLLNSYLPQPILSPQPLPASTLTLLNPCLPQLLPF